MLDHAAVHLGGSDDTAEIRSDMWLRTGTSNRVETEPGSAYMAQEQNATVAQTAPASLVSLETQANGKATTRLHFNTAQDQPSAI